VRKLIAGPLKLKPNRWNGVWNFAFGADVNHRDCLGFSALYSQKCLLILHERAKVNSTNQTVCATRMVGERDL